MLAKKMTKLVVAAGVIAMTAVPSFAAQEARTLDQLRMLVRPGDTITVTGADGADVKGTIEGLSSSELELRVRDVDRRLREADIQRIRQRRDDSLADGARKGFVVGAVLGTLAFASVVGEDGGAVAGAAFIGIYGMFGAGVGAGLDAMVRHDRTIYSASAAAPARKISVRLASW